MTSNTGQTCTTPDGTTLTCTVTGLTNGVGYTFTVTATNGSGTGPASAASAAAVPATVPGAPTGAAAVATNSATTATVTWAAPGTNGGAVITGYTVTPIKAGLAQTPQVFSSTALTEVVTGLSASANYTFTVQATNPAGTGVASAASNSILQGAPGAPTSVSATSNANSQSVVTWTAPTANGGSAITSYTVTSSTGQTCTTPNGTTLTCTVTGLTNGNQLHLYGQGHQPRRIWSGIEPLGSGHPGHRPRVPPPA